MKSKSLYILSALIMLIMTSCHTSKTSLPYFQNLPDSANGVFDVNVNPNIKIEPGDELAVTITSRIPEATAGYNMPLTNPATRDELGMSATPRLQTYIVSNEGDITLPIIGTIHVSGMTTTQLQNYLTKRVSQDVEDPTVRVQFINYYVNVIGEVTRPGRQKVTSERYSLLDALAQAGDLTQYGERTNVLLIRENDGKREYHHFNLNDAATLESPFFYLQQNDVIYVTPNKTRQENSKYNQNNAFKIQVTSTVVSAVSVIASLVIALVIK